MRSAKDRRSALQMLQAQLSGQFGPYVQDFRLNLVLACLRDVCWLKDSSGDVHLDLSFKDGKCSILVFCCLRVVYASSGIGALPAVMTT